MFVVIGATGYVGAACAEALLKRGEVVTVVTRVARHAAALVAKGARVAEADVEDVDALRAAFASGRRAFLLNPPGDVADDADAVERRRVTAMLAALDCSGLEKVVAASVLGARAGERIGDLGVLWELEEGLRRQPIPAAINRGGYYMSNWTPLIDTARRTGKLPSMLPADLDLADVAARPRRRGGGAASLSARRRRRPRRRGPGTLFARGRGRRPVAGARPGGRGGSDTARRVDRRFRSARLLTRRRRVPRRHDACRRRRAGAGGRECDHRPDNAGGVYHRGHRRPLILKGRVTAVDLRLRAIKLRRKMVLPVRIELTTSALPRMRSTTELRQHCQRVAPGEARLERRRRGLSSGWRWD